MIMKKNLILILFLTVLIMIPCGMLEAKGYYVKERVTLSLKKFPGDSSPVIGSANSDDYLEEKDQSGSWVKVVTPKGVEGWTSISYLTNESPRSLIIEQLNAKIASQNDSLRMLQETNKALEKETRELKYKLSNSSLDILKSKNAFQKLKDASSDYLNLEELYNKLTETEKLKSRQLDDLTRENKKLKLSERVKFTLIGGGFIILGLILGYSINLLRGKSRQTGYKL
jgi:SH3 domain protein